VEDEGIIGVDSQCFPIASDRLVKASMLLKSDAQITVGLLESGIETDGGMEALNCLGMLSSLLENGAQIIMRRREIGVDAKCLPKALDCLIRLAIFAK
jgi:hypothetical protein